MTYTTLLFDVKDSIAHITLNRPTAANSINEEMGKDLMHAALRCDEDPEIRAVLISGAGKMFSGGGDLKDFSAKGNQLPYYIKEVTTYFHAAMSRLTRMDAPVVAAVHGAVAGAGLSIAIACDIVVAAETTRFMVAYTRAGLTPDGSATYFLPRIVGLKRALELTPPIARSLRKKRCSGVWSPALCQTMNCLCRQGPLPSSLQPARREPTEYRSGYYIAAGLKRWRHRWRTKAKRLLIAPAPQTLVRGSQLFSRNVHRNSKGYEVCRVSWVKKENTTDPRNPINSRNSIIKNPLNFSPISFRILALKHGVFHIEGELEPCNER